MNMTTRPVVSSPPAPAATPIGYDHEKSAPDVPDCHAYDCENGVFVKSAVSDVDDAITASTTGINADVATGASPTNLAAIRAFVSEPTAAGSPAAATRPDTVALFASFVDSIAVPCWHAAAPGVFHAQAGIATSCRRCAQSAPKAPAKAE